MYKISVNKTNTYTIVVDNKGNMTVDDAAVTPDIVRIGSNLHSVIFEGKSYVAEVVETNRQERKCVIRINGNTYTMDVHDRFSELLLRLGIDSAASQKVTELKAPMPGLVLHVSVKEGETVKKDDNLFTLEAMKMENIIKSPVDAVIRSIKVKLGDKVEKNQVLIVFE